MSYLDPSESPPSRMSPALLMGAASPLWGYFAAATAGGLAFWWMTRWSRPVNLEAVLSMATPMAPPVLEPADVIAEAVVDIPEAPMVQMLAPEAEVERAVAAAPEPVVSITSEPEIQAEPEPELALAPALATVEQVPDPAPTQKVKARKFTPEAPETEA